MGAFLSLNGLFFYMHRVEGGLLLLDIGIFVLILTVFV
jgi:hypothetical protein